MSLYAPKQQFENAPTGLHHAVCVDIQDLGMQETTFGPKHRVTVVFELEDLMRDARPFSVRAWYTFSMFERAPFRQMIESWKGRTFATQKEAEDFDVESLIGESAFVNILHKQTAKGVRANVTNVLPAQKRISPSGHYKRKQGVTPTPQGNQTIDPETGSSTPF